MALRRLLPLVALASAALVLAGWATATRTAALRDLARAHGEARAVTLRVEGARALPAGAAGRVLAAVVADQASQAGVRLSVRLVTGTVPGFAAVDLEAQGSEQALLDLARAIEGERPLVRLVRWSIRPASPGPLRLEARAVAPVAAR